MLEQVPAHLLTRPISVLQRHPGVCCRAAWAWLTTMDRSHLSLGNCVVAPSWLLTKYHWGPTIWPMWLCEAAQAKTLDCGALAAISRDLLRERGDSCFATQLITLFPTRTGRMWNKMWRDAGSDPSWISGSFAYHEVCAIRHGNDLALWDPTENNLLRRTTRQNYGAILGIRVNADTGDSGDGVLQWESVELPLNTWTELPAS